MLRCYKWKHTLHEQLIALYYHTLKQGAAPGDRKERYTRSPQHLHQKILLALCG